MRRLLDTMRRLRAPDGCPWDREQTHETLRPYLIEEAAEAVDALATGDARLIADELGDVLLQIAFHAVIAEESSTFTYDDVESAIVDKLVRRHPHVFGTVSVGGVDDVLTNWHAIKAQEREAAGDPPRKPAEGVPRALPALRRAAELDAALDWVPDDEVADQRLADVAGDPASLGAALLHLAQSARRCGVDPELALRDALEARVAEAS